MAADILVIILVTRIARPAHQPLTPEAVAVQPVTDVIRRSVTIPYQSCCTPYSDESGCNCYSCSDGCGGTRKCCGSCTPPAPVEIARGVCCGASECGFSGTSHPDDSLCKSHYGSGTCYSNCMSALGKTCSDRASYCRSLGGSVTIEMCHGSNGYYPGALWICYK